MQTLQHALGSEGQAVVLQSQARLQLVTQPELGPLAKAVTCALWCRVVYTSTEALLCREVAAHLSRTN